MIRGLLVGVDSSPDGEAALDLAIRWAQRFDAMVVGLGVVDEPGIRGPDESLIGPTFLRRLDQDLIAQSRRQVDLALERCALRCAEAGVAFKPLQDVGTPYVQILTEAQRYDLILLGQETHFRHGWETKGDDTLSQVLSALPRPVVAVPREVPEGESILVAYDGSLQAARTLGAFEATGLGRDRELNVLCAMEDQLTAARHADRASEFLRSHGLRAVPHTLSSFNSAAEAILDFARELQAGLLVMGAYGRPMLREFFLGSVTRTVLKSSTIPVFLYH